MNKNTKTVTVLVVDDNELDRECVEFAFEKAKILNPIVMAKNGIDGLDALRGTNGRERVKRPYIILLDINMPKMDGFEFLEHLREDQELKDSIVFVLTSSSSDRDILKSYAKNIAGYIVKDRIGDDFLKLTELLSPYWRIVELPTANG